MKFKTIALVLAVLSGCGVADTVELKELTESESTMLCEELGEQSCEIDGLTLTSGSDDCSSSEVTGQFSDVTCSATVADLRACNEEIVTCDQDGDLSACGFLFECAFGS